MHMIWHHHPSMRTAQTLVGHSLYPCNDNRGDARFLQPQRPRRGLIQFQVVLSESLSQFFSLTYPQRRLDLCRQTSTQSPRTEQIASLRLPVRKSPFVVPLIATHLLIHAKSTG